MQEVFLFDIDGTLTPPRQPMDPDFARFFRGFVRRHPVYLVSGGDLAKVDGQIPQGILDDCAGVFGSGGAEFRVGGSLVYRKQHNFHPVVLAACEAFVDTSLWQRRHGNHIERRPGLLNISSIGRGAPAAERRRYFEWDREVGERKRFVDAINSAGLGYEASAGGEISIDVSPAGWNKAVAKDEVLRRHPHASLLFFGDRMGEGGNDAPLARALATPPGMHRAIPVAGWMDTQRRLQGWLMALAA